MTREQSNALKFEHEMSRAMSHREKRIRDQERARERRRILGLCGSCMKPDPTEFVEGGLI